MELSFATVVVACWMTLGSRCWEVINAGPYFVTSTEIDLPDIKFYIILSFKETMNAYLRSIDTNSLPII